MGKRTSQQPQGHFSPAVAIAAAAASTSALASFATFALWGMLANPLLPATLALLTPVLVGFAVLAASRWAIGAALGPATDSLDRLAAQDFSAAPSPPCGRETAALVQALARCHTALAARRQTAKLHAAVAKLAGAAMDRLAKGDLSVRIGVDLPPPYEPLRDAFNEIAARLENLGAVHDSPAGRLLQHAQEIGDAAAQLSRRAGKLSERIEAEIDSLNMPGADTEATLQRLLHMMEGVRVATQRNAQAADRFAGLGLLVAQEAGHISAPRDETPDLPAAGVAASTSKPALRMHG